LFLDFTTDVHLNIAWYRRALMRERRMWNAMIALTLALVVATPLGVFFISKGEPLGVTSEITAVLTGLFALYRVVVAAFDRRERFALFHEAGAELKEILYRFEGEWRGLVSQAKQAELTSALKKAITDARAVVKTEQKQFFRTFEKQPALDLGGTLGRSVREAAAIAPVPARPESAEGSRRAAAEAEQRVLNLKKLREASEKEIAAAKERQDKLAEELNVESMRAIHRSLERAEIELAESLARVKSFEPK
jgi:hypothetical protein